MPKKNPLSSLKYINETRSNLLFSTLEHTTGNTLSDDLDSSLPSISRKPERIKSSSSTRVPYVKFTKQQKDILLRFFRLNRKPSIAQRNSLALQLGVNIKKINNWFNNNRQFYCKPVELINAKAQPNQNKTPTNVSNLLDLQNPQDTIDSGSVGNHIINLSFEEIFDLAKIGYLHKYNCPMINNNG